MVRRRKIPKTGVQQHPAETCDNEITVAPSADRSCADQDSDPVTRSIGKRQSAYDLFQSVNNGYELVVECLEWILKRKDDLIRRLREDSISRDEFEEEIAELNLLQQQAKVLSEQLVSSEKKVRKVLENSKKKS